MGRNATFFLRLSLQATIGPWLLLLTRALLPRAATRRLAGELPLRLATVACSPFQTIPMVSSTSRMVVRGSLRRSRNGCNARSGGPAGSKSVPNAGCGGDCLRSEKRRQTDGALLLSAPSPELPTMVLPGQPRSAQILTADSVQQQPIAAPEGSEINHGIHRNTRKRESESTSPFRVLPGGGPTPAKGGVVPWLRVCDDLSCRGNSAARCMSRL